MSTRFNESDLAALKMVAERELLATELRSRVDAAQHSLQSALGAAQGDHSAGDERAYALLDKARTRRLAAAAARRDLERGATLTPEQRSVIEEDDRYTARQDARRSARAEVIAKRWLRMRGGAA